MKAHVQVNPGDVVLRTRSCLSDDVVASPEIMGPHCFGMGRRMVGLTLREVLEAPTKAEICWVQPAGWVELSKLPQAFGLLWGSV